MVPVMSTNGIELSPVVSESTGRKRAVALGALIVAVLGGVAAIPMSGESAGARFLASLRIARPKAVTAAVATVGASNSRQLQNVIAGIVAETTAVLSDEPDAPASKTGAAPDGMTRPLLLGTRNDLTLLTRLGAHSLSTKVNRGQLRTLFTEAGLRGHTVDAAVDGAPITLATPRGIRAEYGNCPAPVANTLANQINGPAPPSTDNGNCVILSETPVGSVSVPAALDTGAVMEIALELSGMSPKQAHEFRSLFGWPAGITLAPPRFMRSYQVVNIGGTQGMLMMTGGRRGPTYDLAWVKGGVVYTLSGYGSSADAVPLATSLH